MQHDCGADSWFVQCREDALLLPPRRELCTELFGHAAKVGRVRDPGSDPALRQDHQTGLVRLSERRLRLQKRYRRCDAVSAGECVCWVGV